MGRDQGLAEVVLVVLVGLVLMRLAELLNPCLFSWRLYLPGMHLVAQLLQCLPQEVFPDCSLAYALSFPSWVSPECFFLQMLFPSSAASCSFISPAQAGP